MRTPQTQSIKSALDPDAWVDHFADELFAYAFSRLRNDLEAEEAVQETFLSGVKNLSQYRGDTEILGWLYGILKRKIVDQLRTRHKHRRLREDKIPTTTMTDDSIDWLYSLPTIEPHDQLEMSELWQVVQTCLTTLPPDQADAFTLTVMEQMEPIVACQILNVSENSFRVRLHRARVKLARCVSKKWVVEDRV